MNDTRKFYLRDADRHPYGCVVVMRYADSHHLFMGMSLVNPDDHWDKELGTLIAEGRAANESIVLTLAEAKSLLSHEEAASFLHSYILTYSHGRGQQFELDEAQTDCRNGRVFAKTLMLMLD